MNRYMQHLEEERLALAAKAHMQRQQLAEYAIAAADFFRRIRTFVLLASGLRFIRGLRKRFGG